METASEKRRIGGKGTGFLFAAILSFLAILPVFSACSLKSPQVIEPPPTPPLSRSIGFAVVVSSYAQVVAEPGGGVALGYYRRGTVVPITERNSVKANGKRVIWMMNKGTESGWIKETDIRLYENEAKAKTASAELLK